MNRRWGGVTWVITLALLVTALACSGTRPRRSTEEIVTFESIRIRLEDDCVHCHQSGGGAPFSLRGYDEVARRTDQILEVVERGIMPPELTSAEGLPLKGRHTISPGFARRVRQWIRDGKRDATSYLHRDYDPEQGFQSLGEPDQVVVESRPYQAPSEGNGLYRTFVFPLQNEEERFLRGIRYAPSDPRLVHGALFVGETTGAGPRYDEATPEPGYAAMGSHGTELVGSLGSWTVGQKHYTLPDGYAWRLGPNTNLCAQVHWNPNGLSRPYTQQLELYYDSAPRRLVTSVTTGNLDIDIPPDQRATVDCEYTLPVDAELVALFPQAHFVCSQIVVDVDLPDAPTIRALDIPDWDPNWMQLFFLEAPLQLPAGARIKATFQYDNTTQNLQNPHSPPQRVQLGQMPDNEVAFVLLHLSPDDAGDLEILERSHRELFDQRLRDRRRKGTEAGSD